MRRALIVCFAILLFGGGAIAFWKVGLPYLEAGQAEQAAAVSTTATPMYVTLPAFVVPLIREGVVTRHLTLGIQVEVQGQKAFDALQGRLPVLTDAFLTELYSLYSLRYVQEHAEELQLAKRRLLEAGERVLGPGVLSGVLVTGVEVRKLDRRPG